MIFGHLDDAVQVYADAAALVKAVRKSFCWVGTVYISMVFLIVQ